jgi:hypothetical protein
MRAGYVRKGTQQDSEEMHHAGAEARRGSGMPPRAVPAPATGLVSALTGDAAATTQVDVKTLDKIQITAEHPPFLSD